MVEKMHLWGLAESILAHDLQIRTLHGSDTLFTALPMLFKEDCYTLSAVGIWNHGARMKAYEVIMAHQKIAWE